MLQVRNQDYTSSLKPKASFCLTKKEKGELEDYNQHNQPFLSNFIFILLFLLGIGKHAASLKTKTKLQAQSEWIKRSTQ